ncbi:HIT family protein [Deinococcus frigens]|uniref:HIT family protein n=1 Tax=Deinococcus frigens TaxID=249403 RepID=UPI00049511AE|nr:HIT family protein [Deinococcus frigens]
MEAGKAVFRALAAAPHACLNRECITCTPPQDDPDTIFFTDGWKVILHPSQCGLGNVLLATRRHVPRMADLTPAEWQEFQTVIAALELALERAFGAALINMAYQRNWAYREAEPDPPSRNGQPNPHVHWHITPRYAQAVHFGDMVFEDPTFGEPFEWRKVTVPAEVRRAIVERLQMETGVIMAEDAR